MCFVNITLLNFTKQTNSVTQLFSTQQPEKKKSADARQGLWQMAM